MAKNSGINRTINIPQANIFGRIGTGIGQGLGEQIPKEIERARLAAGLKQLGEQKDQTPFQQFSALASIPGVTPQMIESGSKLLRESARGQALALENQPKPSPFTQEVIKAGAPSESNVPSITKQEPLANIQEGYIPPTQEEIYSRAGKRYNENPALFGNDPQKAIDAEIDRASREQQIADAYQTHHANLSKIQDNVVDRLRGHSQTLKVKVPANVYSKVEDEAIQATKPKKDGGRGLTEQQAMKEYGDKLDAISRDYSGLDSLSGWGITGRKANESLRVFKSLQKKFDERHDTENMADTLIGENGLSPMTAYAIAEPVSSVPAIQKRLSTAPSIQKPGTEKGYLIPNYDPERTAKTLELAKELAPLLTEKGSPLAVAYELDKKGYDGSVWLDYVSGKRDDLNLRSNQIRQLDKPGSVTGTLNDWWLSSWTGLDNEGE